MHDNVRGTGMKANERKLLDRKRRAAMPFEVNASKVVENCTKIGVTDALALLADADTDIKDVRAHCFCASLLRTQIHSPRHALSAHAKYYNEQ